MAVLLVAIVVALPTPTEVPLLGASTAWLTMVAAATTPDEAEAPVPHRQADLLDHGVIRIAPVREEHRDVLA
jgi:hypothetical protein